MHRLLSSRVLRLQEEGHHHYFNFKLARHHQINEEGKEEEGGENEEADRETGELLKVRTGQVDAEAIPRMVYRKEAMKEIIAKAMAGAETLVTKLAKDWNSV